MADIMKFENMTIYKNGGVRILYHNETTNEDGDITAVTKHRESLHISESENHGFTQVSALFADVALYPAKDQEPTVSDVDLATGRALRAKQIYDIAEIERIRLVDRVDSRG